ncbi:L-2-hydroxyglutarate oxidase LhgO [bacterium BMS3Abin03]|nr:L-2-hydroxyglutarate oxidase LhgO [bacterium BMS3Abin03]
MPDHKIYDFVIIGGGIVGTATALALLRDEKYSILIIEAEDKLAAHQTGNNSGVIHSGLYYKPGSLKAENCTRGRQLLYDFCEEHNINYEKCGKIVVAVSEEELPKLEMLYERGTANGLKGIKKLSGDELKEYEPSVSGIAGLFVPQTGIVDYVQVTKTYAELIKKKNGKIETGCKFLSLKKKNDELILSTTTGKITTKFLINCAGLYSDRVAEQCGIEPGLQIIPFRGEYYKLKKDSKQLVKNLIYPVPDPKFPFLGVHFTRMINGGVEAGPNAVLAFKREGYSHKDISFKDSFQMFTYSGFWRMAFKYYRMGFSEFYRSLNKRAFVSALKKLIPSIEITDIERGGAGVRAQALEPGGNLVDDFRIKEAGRMLHVLNAPSPAATASLSIGDTIAKMAVNKFNREM